MMADEQEKMEIRRLAKVISNIVETIERERDRERPTANDGVEE